MDAVKRYPIECPDCGAVVAEHMIIGGSAYLLLGGLVVDYVSALSNPMCAVCGVGFQSGLSSVQNIPKFLRRRVTIQVSTAGNTIP